MTDLHRISHANGGLSVLWRGLQGPWSMAKHFIPCLGYSYGRPILASDQRSTGKSELERAWQRGQACIGHFELGSSRATLWPAIRGLARRCSHASDVEWTELVTRSSAIAERSRGRGVQWIIRARELYARSSRSDQNGCPQKRSCANHHASRRSDPVDVRRTAQGTIIGSARNPYVSNREGRLTDV